MIDRSAPLVDITAFLMMFMLVLFIITTSAPEKKESVSSGSRVVFSIEIDTKEIPISNLKLSNEISTVSFDENIILGLFAVSNDEFLEVNKVVEKIHTKRFDNLNTLKFYGIKKNDFDILIVSFENLGVLSHFGKEFVYSMELIIDGKPYRKNGSVIIGRSPFIYIKVS